MRAWLLLLSGLLIWAGHFFGIYIGASLFPGTSLARWLTGFLTLLALGLLAALLRHMMQRAPNQPDDPLQAWLDRLTNLGSALAAVAVLYQAVPALMA